MPDTRVHEESSAALLVRYENLKASILVMQGQLRVIEHEIRYRERQEEDTLLRFPR